MAISFRRTLSYSTLYVLALVATIVFLPAQAYAGCTCGGLTAVGL